MSDTNPNANPPADEGASKEVDAFRASVRSALTLGDDADDAAILAALTNTAKERDEHRARADKVIAERDTERLDSGIRSALDRSRMDKRNLPDALTLMRPLFTVDEKGRVVTKGGDSGEPGGLTPDEFVSSRLTSLRGHWFPVSVGGGATGGGPSFDTLGDTSAFDPRSPNFNVTRQFALEAERGTKWADAARRKYQ